jgi:hypothetical protein
MPDIAANSLSIAFGTFKAGYAVFEDMALGDYGNRIPSLTFEVIADPGPVQAGDVMAEIAEGAILSAGASQPLAGFSAYGESVRAVAETLAGADSGWFAAEGGALRFVSGDGEALAVADPGARAPGHGGSRGNRAIAAADSAPRSLTLAHYDPDRDYQTGLQRAVRPGPGTREARLELPAVIDAATAKTIAEAGLARFDVARAADGSAWLGRAGDPAGRAGGDRRRAGDVASRSLGTGGDGGDAGMRRGCPRRGAGGGERRAGAARARSGAGRDIGRSFRAAASG